MMCANDPSPQPASPPGADLFRAAFESAPVAMALLAGDSRLLEANAAFAELLGCGDVATLVGQQYLDFVDGDDRGRCQEAWARLGRRELRSALLEQGYVGCTGDAIRARVSFSWAGEAPSGCLLVQVVELLELPARKSAGLQLSLLSLVLDRMQEAAFLIDEHGRFHYVNEKACQSLGYSREELVVMAVPDIDPDWRYERYRKTWPSFRVRGSLTLETRHRAKDGTLRRVEVTANYFEHDGRAYNLALVQDISERKRVEAALRQSERRYREIFENVSDALFLLEVTPDYRYRYLAMNSAFERSVGMSRGQLVGRFVEDTLPAETARTVVAKYRHCLVLEAPVDEEIELDLPFGRRAYHSTLIPVYDSTLGRFHRIVGITRDVTLRRQHARVLEERGELERRLSHFAACAPGLMYTCRMRPDGSFHFPYASPGIERLFGISPESVAEDMTALEAALHVDDLPCFLAAARASALKLLPFHLDFRANHPSKGCLWVEARAAPERMPDGSTLWHGFMHDITERKRMEVEAEIHRSWLRTLIQTIPDPVWVKSPDGVFLACNNAFGRLYAVDEAGLLGKTDFDYVAPELATFFQEMDRQAIASGGPRVNEEWVRYAADGRQALWETIKTPLYDASGRVTGVLGVARDITERKRLEDELREKDGYQRALLDNFPFMVWLKDTESRFLAVNQPFADVAGVDSSDAVLGKTDLDFFPADLATAYRSDDREVLRLKRQKIVEEQIADRGVRKCFETYKAPVEVDGRLLGTVGFARDITQRKLMEEQLRTSERQFRMLAENSPSFIVRYDRNARRTYVNPAYLREVGLSAEQAVSLALDVNWCGSPSVDDYKACLQHVLQTGVPAEMLLAWEARDGRLSNYVINLVAECGPDGLPDGVLAIGHNITALKEAELRLRESRDLLRELSARRETAREEERKRIAREIHDELGQHLTALRMGISVLRFQFGRRNQLLSERVAALMALADKTIQVVRDVATTLRPAALDMGLPAALEWLVAEFGRHTGIPCLLRVPENEPELAEDRATAVFRVVQESLTNVARHSAASQVTVTLECSADGLLLEVTDNGQGFDPLAAGRNTYGLLSMRERGLMLGGDVAVVSAPGAGTSVRMTLPVRNAAEVE